VLRRERPVPAGILAAALAFRLFALMIPLAYMLEAGIGLTLGAAERAGQTRDEHLSDLVVDSIAAVARTSERGRFVALIVGGAATLLAAGGRLRPRERARRSAGRAVVRAVVGAAASGCAVDRAGPRGAGVGAGAAGVAVPVRPAGGDRRRAQRLRLDAPPP
jgi:hypothetical protein